jgi:ribosomal protection tetracycline resistance protein
MLRRTLNLGILAHVDAGKTTLTERLLHAAGVIDEIGSVDDGTTQTDSLALEQQRGITIKSAVVSFAIEDVTVNLIDTPGHPDFIAEVERVLSVLDGAVLVISAVEGVQPQTRILMRALQRLCVPTLIFVNKIDRAGADGDRVVGEIAGRLTPAIVALGEIDEPGTRGARFTPCGEEDAAFRTRLTEALAEGDDAILAAFVEDEASVPYARLREELASQTGDATLHPVFFGSAITGAGVRELMGGIAELLPASAGDADGPVAGTVFKIERAPAGEKIAYVRLFSGTVRTRDRVRFGRDGEGKVTAVAVFDRGTADRRTAVSAGEIGKLWGLGEILIGDGIGERESTATQHQFAPPTLEALVVPDDPDEMGALRIALLQLAEQDPLIDVRQDDARRELSVSLYGEVQKEVVQATLQSDFGIDATLRETTTICIERPRRRAEAVEIMHADTNPFAATIGLRVEPAPAGSGIDFDLDVDFRDVPLYFARTMEAFADLMDRFVRTSLQEGLHGWQVTDCLVTMVECNYQSPDGSAATRGPLSSAADYRKLTPIVVMEALERAGTVVCEPVFRVGLEFPTAAIGAVLAALARLGAATQPPEPRGELSTIETMLSATRVQELQRQLPGLTSGEGVLESDFAGYEPVSGDPPARRRTTPNPLNLSEYLMHLSHRASSIAGEVA